MTEITRPGRLIWDNKQGWTCEKLPPFSNDELGVVVQMKNGIPQVQMKERLLGSGLNYRVCHIGKNDPKLSKETNLVYLVQICKTYDELLRTIGLLQTLEIPVSAISVIDSQLF